MGIFKEETAMVLRFTPLKLSPSASLISSRACVIIFCKSLRSSFMDPPSDALAYHQYKVLSKIRNGFFLELRSGHFH